ncbi:hypothetical protein EYC84_006420 [Monilinia fructicola]|uniref:Uncharacterized protein n=1 Tax=Monilinia fructicola TaxID=38448 RepID=A0A5M9K613_MONFR|nr:hypothetical protein EYC84_006420 [Monilinia fructicola]
MATQAQPSNLSPKEFSEVLGTVARAETTRTYVFPSLKELHLFQTALTGFVVSFDGKASSFNISRRRMVVPIYKKWDAATTRVQLVQKEKIVQLLAFFENFNHGDCMGFTLKSTDTFESSNKSGKFSLRIVDAKFAMPKPRGEGTAALDSAFVNLDMPDYPGEHDDITVVFDTETERDTFAKSLPAPVKVASRMGSHTIHGCKAHGAYTGIRVLANSMTERYPLLYWSFFLAGINQHDYHKIDILCGEHRSSDSEPQVI